MPSWLHQLLASVPFWCRSIVLMSRSLVQGESKGMPMTPAEWIGLLAVLVGIAGSVVAWMIRISRQLARVEAIVEPLGAVKDTVREHGVRISVLEASR